jgi:hypothetical protein
MGSSKAYEVTVSSGSKSTIHAGNISFTVSGDLVFEDEARDFQESYAKGYWKHVREIKESN